MHGLELRCESIKSARTCEQGLAHVGRRAHALAGKLRVTPRHHLIGSRTLMNPRGSIYTTIMELGPQNHNGDGLLGPNSITVVYMDPLGTFRVEHLQVEGLAS